MGTDVSQAPLRLKSGSPSNPETHSGLIMALAGYLLWGHELGKLSDWPELAASFIKEPWPVHRYLDRGVNPDSELPSRLERTQILALHGR